MTYKAKQVLAVLVVFLTMISVSQWSSMPLGNTYTDWILYACIMFIFLFKKKYYYDKSNESNLWLVKVYVLWLVTCFVRGLFAIENYWDFKNLMNASFALFLTLSIYVLTNPDVIQNILKTWLKYALPLFILFSLIIDPESYGYYLIAISFLGLFFPIFNLKWRLILIGISLFVIIASPEARTNVIKFVLPVLFSILYYFRIFLKTKLFKLFHIVLFLLPILLFILAGTNIFNVFKMDEYLSGNYVGTRIEGGEKMEVDLKGDTRTFLYKEVITSAIKNEYVLFGRTPARGNDSQYFGAIAAEELGTHRYERPSNEVSVLNIFTWTGLVGIILYFLIFFKAAQLAIYQSNSSFLKILGLYVSFRWVSAWVEDFNRFDIMNLMLWLAIAMCYSTQFRKMTDKDFKIWFNGIFKSKNKNKKMRLANYQVPFNNFKNFNEKQ